jgi:hypothetical protein
MHTGHTGHTQRWAAGTHEISVLFQELGIACRRNNKQGALWWALARDSGSQQRQLRTDCTQQLVRLCRVCDCAPQSGLLSFSSIAPPVAHGRGEGAEALGCEQERSQPGACVHRKDRGIKWGSWRRNSRICRRSCDTAGSTGGCNALQGPIQCATTTPACIYRLPRCDMFTCTLDMVPIGCLHSPFRLPTSQPIATSPPRRSLPPPQDCPAHRSAPFAARQVELLDSQQRDSWPRAFCATSAAPPLSRCSLLTPASSLCANSAPRTEPRAKRHLVLGMVHLGTGYGAVHQEGTVHNGRGSGQGGKILRARAAVAAALCLSGLAALLAYQVQPASLCVPVLGECAPAPACLRAAAAVPTPACECSGSPPCRPALPARPRPARVRGARCQTLLNSGHGWSGRVWGRALGGGASGDACGGAGW